MDEPQIKIQPGSGLLDLSAFPFSVCPHKIDGESAKTILHAADLLDIAREVLNEIPEEGKGDAEYREDLIQTAQALRKIAGGAT